MRCFLLSLFVVFSLGVFDYDQYCFASPLFAAPLSNVTLVKAILVTRHGDRTPVNVLPEWLERNVQWNCTLSMLVQSFVEEAAPMQRVFRKSYIPRHDVLPNSNCQFGQLTSRGAQQHQQVGKNFRASFVPALLPAQLDTTLMYVRSTDLQRTILSSYNLLNGMYGDSPDVVTVHIADSDTDETTGGNTKLCPKLTKLYAAIYNSSDYTTYYNTKLGNVVQRLQASWPNVSITPSFMHALNDILRSRLCHSLPLPFGMSQEDAETIMTVESVLSNMAQNTQEILSLTMFSMLNEFVQVIQGTSVSVPSTAKLVYYSAHDSTLRNLLLALQVFDGHWPPLASHFVLEVYEGNLFRLQFDGQLLTLPGCNNSLCSLSVFTSLVRSYAVDLATACQQ